MNILMIVDDEDAFPRHFIPLLEKKFGDDEIFVVYVNKTNKALQLLKIMRNVLVVSDICFDKVKESDTAGIKLVGDIRKLKRGHVVLLTTDKSRLLAFEAAEAHPDGFFDKDPIWNTNANEELPEDAIDKIRAAINKLNNNKSVGKISIIPMIKFLIAELICCTLGIITLVKLGGMIEGNTFKTVIMTIWMVIPILFTGIIKEIELWKIHITLQK